MNIMDAFRSLAGSNNAPAANNQPPVNANKAADPNAVNSNQTIPNATTLKKTDDSPLGSIPKAGEGDQSPLAKFNDLWETKDTDAKPLDFTTSIKIDPKKFNDAAAGMDFTKILNPELVAQASKGDAAAMAALINQAAQAGVSQNAQIATKIAESAINGVTKKFMEVILPAKLKEFAVSQNLRADNKLFESPAVSPVLTMVEERLQAKYPGASPAEITAHAKEYLTAMGTELVGASGKIVSDKPVETKAPGGINRTDTDWGKFFGDGS